ncbi:MAG TPA: c-type cytochrome [Gammaproteobacteria bacterium]|nr:c-type cytochrome [Gammaproteobacteria bacterium]
MKQFIEKFLSKKRNVVFATIVVAAIGISIIYTIAGISRNVQQMTSLSPDDVDQYFPTYPPVNTAGKDPELIKKGEYLAKAGDCIACHTNSPQKGKTFAGGLPMQTPFGTIFSPNITPDKETGIGSWTDEQFIKAMREGISPHGHFYYPAFPYLYFNKITTEDLKALKAYLDSIPAVNQKNLKNKMVWPFNVRLLQAPWRWMFFHPTAVYEGVPEASEKWKRGEYLVEGFGHCAMCHSPSYKIFTDKLPLGAPIQKFDLTGSKIQGYLAPNITKANLNEVSEQEITDVFLKDRMIGGGPVEGPMLEVNHDSLRYLTPEDLSAIAVYLKSVQSKSPPKPTGPAAGKALYENYCSGCHASGAGGAPKYGDAADWTPVLKGGINKVYENAIKGIGGMPAKGTCVSCNDQDIKQAVDYMLVSVTGPDGKIASVAPIKKLTMEEGKLLYDQNCSVCHANGFQQAPKPGDVEAWKPMVEAGFLDTYINVLTGRKGHPPHGACATCSDADLKAAVKYMMQQSAPGKDYSLW